MEKEKNIKLNAVLNAVKSGLSILFPLITFPYALRVVGVVNIGKISYVTSIVTYFMMFAMLGVNSYAVREGAKIRKDKKRLECFASEVFTINIIFMLLSYVLLFLTIFLIKRFQSYDLLFFIIGLSIVFQVLSIEWVNTIFEDFLYITIRSIAIYVINMLFLFIFVKTENDYILYAVLQVVPNGIICVLNQFYCRKYIHIRITRKIHFSEHIRPLLILFANTIMVTIYVNFDTTMLGWINGDVSVGMYSSAVRIYSAIKSILVAIYIVTVPRLATYIGQNNSEEFRSLFTKICSTMTVLVVPMIVGLVFMAEEIMLLVGGANYVDASNALRILAGALLFAVYAGLITSCINITMSREKENLVATTISAILNFALNIVFIPILDYLGAAITTMISEAFVLFFCYARLPEKTKYIDRNSIIKNTIQAIFGSCGIIITILMFKILIKEPLLRLIITIIVSVIVYSICLIFQKNEFANELKSDIKNKF